MKKTLMRLWNDDAGALIASEFLFVATILVIGTIMGLATVRTAVNVELSELANALLALSQGYILQGQTGCGASTDGSQAIDSPATVTAITSVPPANPSLIDILPCQ